MSGAADRLAQRNREIEFLRTYDPALDDPIPAPTPQPSKYAVRVTPRFTRQFRMLDRWLRAGRKPFVVEDGAR